MSTMPEYPTEITLETLPQLFAAHRARFGGWTMIDPPANPAPPADPPPPGAPAFEAPPAPAGPQRPEGVSEEEWNALGDPGQRAITREREARQAAERQLAAARAPKPAPPAKKAAATPPKPSDPPEGDPDIASIIKEAVAAAIQPFQEREEERTAEQAATKIQKAVLDSAADTFLDPTDALTGIDLTQVTDGNGGADPAKIQKELEDLLVRKPHLGRTPDGRRYAAPGSPAGAAHSAVPLETKVQETLKRMQAATGVKSPS